MNDEKEYYFIAKDTYTKKQVIVMDLTDKLYKILNRGLFYGTCISKEKFNQRYKIIRPLTFNEIREKMKEIL